MKRLRWLLLLNLTLVCVNGCSLFRAAPVEDTFFLPFPDVVMERRDRAPFNGYWVYDPTGYDLLRNDYKKIYIAPVDTTYVRKQYNAVEGDREIIKRRIQEAEQLASYFRSKVMLLFAESDYTIADAPGPRTLTLQLALVQIVPTNPGINLVGTVAGFFVPGGGLLKVIGEGSIAMEGYISEENKVPFLYEQFKDREGHKYRPFSIKDYERYAHIRQIIDEWSMQLHELFTTTHDTMIEDSDLVSINPL